MGISPSGTSMAVSIPLHDPGRCDTQDHGVTPARYEELKNEAHALNQILRLDEPGPRGAHHKAAMLQAEKTFYSFLPGEHDLNGGSLAACQAFYEQVTKLPIGERRKLLELTAAENQEMHGHNPLMPVMVVDMDSSAFINSLDFHLGSLEYTFHYLGMCAEVQPIDVNSPNNAYQRAWGFDLPTLNLRR